MTEAETQAEPALPRIWVDADACPTVIRDILFRAAERVGIELTLVANQWIRTPPSRWLRSIQVPQGLDVADSAIVERVAAAETWSSPRTSRWPRWCWRRRPWR